MPTAPIILQIMLRCLHIIAGAAERSGGRGGGAKGAKAPCQSAKGGLSPPQIDTVPNCTSSNKIEIL